MIRRSVFVAIIAISISVLVHLIGLIVTVPELSDPASGETGTDTIELSNAFEELADTRIEPVPPAPDEPPTPPVEPPTQPQEAEIPTSDARVASPNPQETFTPDTGKSTIIQPRAPDEVVVDPVDQNLEDEGEAAEAEGAVSARPEALAETPEVPIEEAVDPVEPSSAEEPASEEQQQVAALPVEVAPVVPEVTPPLEPVIPEEASEPLDEETELTVPDANVDGSEQAVATSLRPRLPDRRPQPTLRGALDPSSNFDALRFPEQTIESPLTTYQREGVDAFRQNRGGTRSGGRGPGNSDSTNYAGQVLVHLNRAPVVYVAGRGYARVFFQIDPDGSLAWVDVVESSGSPEIERAAKEQVRTAAPFPRPPGGVSRKLSFYYQIR